MGMIIAFFYFAVRYQKCYKKYRQVPDIGKMRSDGYEDCQKNARTQEKKAPLVAELVQAEYYDQVI